MIISVYTTAWALSCRKKNRQCRSDQSIIGAVQRRCESMVRIVSELDGARPAGLCSVRLTTSPCSISPSATPRSPPRPTRSRPTSASRAVASSRSAWDWSRDGEISMRAESSCCRAASTATATSSSSPRRARCAPTTSTPPPSRRHSAARRRSSRSPRSIAATRSSRSSTTTPDARAEKAVIDYGFHLIIADPNEHALNEELPALIRRGITSFKVYMTYDLPAARRRPAARRARRGRPRARARDGARREPRHDQLDREASPRARARGAEVPHDEPPPARRGRGDAIA